MVETEESIVVATRRHWRRLVLAVLALPVLVGAVSYAVAATPAGPAQSPLRIAELVVALALLLKLCLARFLVWRAGWLLVTDRRVCWQSGVLRRRSRDLPLHRVVEVYYDQTLPERLLRSGTLRVEAAGEGGALVVADVPRVRRVYRLIVARTGASEALL